MNNHHTPSRKGKPVRSRGPIRDRPAARRGSSATRAEFSLYTLDSYWVIENRAVEPDIVIENTRPTRRCRGHDPQLEKAIEVVLEEVERHRKKLPPRPPDFPPYPSRSGN
jgi:tricorn protease